MLSLRSPKNRSVVEMLRIFITIRGDQRWSRGESDDDGERRSGARGAIYQELVAMVEG